MDSIPVADIRRFEGEFLDFIARERKAILEVIAETKDLSDDTVASLSEAIATFTDQFVTSDQKVKEAAAAALDAASVGQETVTRYVTPAVEKK